MNDIKADLLGREVVPFYLLLVALVLVAIFCYALLHLFISSGSVVIWEFLAP